MNGMKDDGDSPKTAAAYQEAAARGDARSQAQLGKMYLLGVGAERNYKLALEWNRKAAEQGDGEAQANLGHMFERGLGVEPDMRKALDLYKKSTAQDNALGQIRMGDLYLRGLGVDPSPRKALALFLKSAEQGEDPESAGLALRKMGAMYCQGRGVEKDLRRGFDLHHQAALLGNAEAQLAVGAMYRDGAGVERNHKKALEWFQKSSGKSNVPADSAMGDIYRDGLLVEKNIPEAMKWYKKAAERGEKYAKNELLKLQQEEGTAPGYKAQAPPAGNGAAQAPVAVAGRNRPGVGVEQSAAKASAGQKKAVADGNASLPGKRQPRPPSPPATLPKENRAPERPKQKVAAARNANRGAHAVRTRHYRLAAIGTIGAALVILFLGIGKKAGQTPGILDLGVMKTAVLPEPQRLLPLPVQPAREILQRIQARQASRKASTASPAASAEANPAAMPIAPVAPRLRRDYRPLDEGQVSAMLAAQNLFDAERNPMGNFRHQYEAVNVAGSRLIVDRATRLVWTRQQNRVKMNLAKSRQWIESLNRVGYGGIGSWRLPTVEEAAALLQKNTAGKKDFVDAVFGSDMQAIWTGDRLGESESWAIDFQNGMIQPAKTKSRLMTLMVSSDPGSARD